MCGIEPTGSRGGRGCGQLAVAGERAAIRVDDTVEHAIVLGQRQQIEGRGRQVDLHRTIAQCDVCRNLVGRTDQQTIVGLTCRLSPEGQRSQRDHHAPGSQNQRDRDGQTLAE